MERYVLGLFFDTELLKTHLQFLYNVHVVLCKAAVNYFMLLRIIKAS